MKEEGAHINKELENLFRNSYGKIISILLSKYGMNNLDLAENAGMEAYLRALKIWPYEGLPKNPQAWLIRTAINACIDELRKGKVKSDYRNAQKESHVYIDELRDDIKIEDPELKLLFLICHPDLNQEDQMAFMLKTLSGFGDQEIANALMIKKATVKKRLLRARVFIKENNIVFDWPSKAELRDRLSMVHVALYLLFNEGFYSTHSDYGIRKDLCLEAMRLCKYLVDHKIANSETNGLMSLMCYHISRYEGRLDDEGQLILLEDQDRNKWSSYFIKIGGYYLQKSAEVDLKKSRFQIEAFISAQHCTAKDLKSTNWKLLKELYEGLYKMTGQEIILLNLVIVNSYLGDFSEAKKIFNAFEIEKSGVNKLNYFMTGLKMYEMLQDDMKIEIMLERALNSSNDIQSNQLLKERIDKINKDKTL